MKERATSPLRHPGWANLAPRVAHADSFLLRGFRNELLTATDIAWRVTLETFVQDDHTVPADQIIEYPAVADHRRYTFTRLRVPRGAVW